LREGGASKFGHVSTFTAFFPVYFSQRVMMTSQ
jgi:hypothetical protein